MRHVWLDAWTEKMAMTDWMEEREGCVMVRVLVVPRASRTRILGVHDGRLKIQLAAPPVDGQANKLLIKFMADELGVAKAQLDVVAGATSKRKTVRVAAVNPQRVRVLFEPPSTLLD